MSGKRCKMAQEIWMIILGHVDRLTPAVNLILAHRGVYHATKHDRETWTALEKKVANSTSYQIFCRRRRHLGVRRRVMAWASMMRSPCFGCRMTTAAPMHYIGVKLCPKCCPGHLVSQEDLLLVLGTVAKRLPLPYAWIQGKKHFFRPHVKQLLSGKSAGPSTQALCQSGKSA